jgi:hypothetical protein
MKNENNILIESVARLRRLKYNLNEENEKNDVLDAVPYTSNDDLLAEMTNEAKSLFGADFSKSKTPMLYYPKDGDVTLTGEIPGLENAKFQFKLNSNSDGSGIILWVDSLPISDSAISTLSKLNGAGKNWKKRLNEIGRQDVKPVSVRDNDNSTEQIEESFVEGDDLD